MVLLTKRLAIIVCAEDPFISIVPEIASKVPLFVTVPEICKVLPVTVSDDPESIIKSLTAPMAPLLNTGLFGTSGI